MFDEFQKFHKWKDKQRTEIELMKDNIEKKEDIIKGNINKFIFKDEILNKIRDIGNTIKTWEIRDISNEIQKLWSIATKNMGKSPSQSLDMGIQTYGGTKFAVISGTGIGYRYGYDSIGRFHDVPFKVIKFVLDNRDIVKKYIKPSYQDLFLKLCATLDNLNWKPLLNGQIDKSPSLEFRIPTLKVLYEDMWSDTVKELKIKEITLHLTSFKCNDESFSYDNYTLIFIAPIKELFLDKLIKFKSEIEVELKEFIKFKELLEPFTIANNIVNKL